MYRSPVRFFFLIFTQSKYLYTLSTDFCTPKRYLQLFLFNSICVQLNLQYKDLLTQQQYMLLCSYSSVHRSSYRL